jgi:hypothetical protein
VVGVRQGRNAEGEERCWPMNSRGAGGWNNNSLFCGRPWARKQQGASTMRRRRRRRLVVCQRSWQTKRSAERKLNRITKSQKSRSDECYVYKLELKEAEDERMRAGVLLGELNECRAEKDRQEREKERMEEVMKQCQREMSKLKVKEADFDRYGQGKVSLS